jgi:hypothetical protein
MDTGMACWWSSKMPDFAGIILDDAATGHEQDFRPLDILQREAANVRAARRDAGGDRVNRDAVFTGGLTIMAWMSSARAS